MAGGSGTRLWPLSRRARPKQLLKLFGGKSLLQISRARLAGLFEPADIWVVTSDAYLDLVAGELPDIPRENLIGEPMGRDTANAIGLAAHLIAQRDTDATMAVFTADHLIRPQEVFARSIETGLSAAERNADSLVTFGIMPTEPHTGYGYIHLGESAGAGVFQVLEFKEKPPVELARQYVESGEYLWNSGMFAWRVSAILSEFQRCLPENHAGLAALAGEWSASSGTASARRFEQLERVSIDFGVMEKARHVLVAPMQCHWVDLGSWDAIAATRDADAYDNVTVADNALVVDGRGNLLVTEDDHLLVTLGVSDIVVVHAGDATLVCHKDQVQRVKEIVEACGTKFGDRFS
jgi:mannose-1-phosphate guanylyltransferase